MRVLIFLLLLVSFTSIKAQNYIRPIVWNFNKIELKLLLKGSDGEDVVFGNHENMVWFSSDKRFKLFSFEIDYHLANREDKHFTRIKGLDSFFEQVYRNHPDDYIDRIKRILNVNRYGCFPSCKKSIYHYPLRGVTVVDEVNEYCFPTDTIIYRYESSCNVNCAKSYDVELIETPYFVPIKDVEIFFVQDGKTMHVCFELYDYKNMGFSYRPLYKYNTDSIDECLSVFMEIHFQEGDFVVTDVSFPNLIKK